MKFYRVPPMAKPRPQVTQRGVFIGKKSGAKWKAFKTRCHVVNMNIPSTCPIFVFDIPMPKSWTKKRKAEMLHTAHQQTPDKDNLEKAVLDAVLPHDSQVFAGLVVKRWTHTDKGGIWIGDMRVRQDRVWTLSLVNKLAE